MSDEVQYESKRVKAIRGMEARTIAKWTADGWEFVGQTPGAISSELSFRRVKRKISRAVIAAAAGIAVLVVVAITIGAITERNDPTSAAPPVSATTDPGGSASETGAPTTRASTTAAASPSEPTPVATLTTTNNDFAKVLKADYCDDRIDTFATKYEGETVEFAGIILDLAPRGDTKTRYDILIAPGDKVEATEGPLFRYEDVNTTNDFGWASSDIPDTVGKGSKLLFAARVGDFDTDRCLLSMTPVATQGR